MEKVTYEKEITALLVIDPYNDFISEGGKIWDRLKAVAEANNCVPNMLEVLNAARKVRLRVFYALHHRYRPGDYEIGSTLRPFRRQGWSTRALNTARGVVRSAQDLSLSQAKLSPRSIGVPVVSPTQLDLQLKKHGIHKLIIMGLIAHTSVEDNCSALPLSLATRSRW